MLIQDGDVTITAGAKWNSPSIVRHPKATSINVMVEGYAGLITFMGRNDDELRSLFDHLLESPELLRAALNRASKALTPGH